MADFTLTNHGSLCMLTPHTEAAEQWIDDNLPADRQTLGRSVAIEPRYAADIVSGIRAEGLTINA